MSFLDLILLSFGLAADATAVSITSGSIYKKAKFKDFARMALYFGVFQSVMPVLGYFLGTSFEEIIKYFDHWVAFALLLFVGGKMIYEAIKNKAGVSESAQFDDIHKLFVLAIATSIDALAVGITFSVIDMNLLFSVLTIGIITFFCSLIGVYLGKKVGKYLSNKVEIIGGIILIGIGIKILVSHLLS